MESHKIEVAVATGTHKGIPTNIYVESHKIAIAVFSMKTRRNPPHKTSIPASLVLFFKMSLPYLNDIWTKAPLVGIPIEK